MFGRIIAISIALIVLVGLIVYSQMHSEPEFVSGIVETDEIRLGSRVGGRIKEVHIQEGDFVSAGDRLIELEPYDLEEREQQAIADLAQSEAMVEKLQTGERPESIAQSKARYEKALAELSLKREGPRQEEIAAAKNRQDAAQSELELAKSELDRVADLVQTNAVSKSEYDRALEKWKAAQANLNVRQNELQILQSGSRKQEIEIAEKNVEELNQAWELAKTGFRQEEIKQAIAAKNAAAAALQIIRKQKEELVVRAPANGYIDALDLHAGDLIAPNAPMITMLLHDDVWIRAYVPQRYLKLQVGQKLKVVLDSFPDEEFYGTISFVSHQAEFTPSNVQTPDDRAKQVYRVRVSLDETEKVRSGMTANVWLNPVDTNE
jgi:HlyD family secretion protein